MSFANKIKKFFSISLILLFIIIPSCSIVSNALSSDIQQVPSNSYSYWDSATQSFSVNQKPTFKYIESISSTSLGIKSFETLSDMFLDDDGNIYLVDKDTNELIIINNKYEHIKTLSEFKQNEQMIEISKLVGVYVSSNGDIYLCDSDGGKIVVCDLEGNVSRMIQSPDKSVLPEGFVFKPTNIIIDSKNYMFVLCEGSYYGAMIFNANTEFVGFYGANKVSSSVTDVIKTLWKNLTTTNEKRANSAKTLPFSFTDVCIDDKGFVYTVTGATTEKGEQKGVVRRLSPSGVNIMNSEEEVFGEKTLGRTSLGGIVEQNICGLCIDDYGFVYTYDRTLGNIYMYDEESHLITAFGGGMGKGTQNGTYVYPCAIQINDTKLYVCDGLSGYITVYEMTDYGVRLRDLQRQTLDGNYSVTKEGWQQILKENKNCQLAYIGLAKVAYAEEDYKLSLDYAKLGEDRNTYAKAFEKVRDVFLSENFVIVFCTSILLIVILIAIFIYKQKKNIVLIKNDELKLALLAVIHPYNVFSEIKEKNKGKFSLAMCFLVLFYVSTVIKNDFSGFLFVDPTSTAFNSLVVMLRTVGAVFLWIVSNWLISTLFGGIGKIKEIFITVSYALMPMTVVNFAYTILSRCLTDSEASFLSLMVLIAQAYFIIILAIGTMKIHDFSFGKFVGTSLLSLLTLLLIIFIAAMIFILAQQFVSFFVTLTYEIVLR